LQYATLANTDLTGADLTGCRIHGVSAWGVKLDSNAKQQNLVITRGYEPTITVDNIEVAQFVYLMLNNQKVRDVIDTITSKAVLILGRFTDERKAVLDALRDELRKRNYLPILFDFEVPAGGNITETVTLLARMARFIIADLTDPSSIPQELQAIVPHLAKPVQPLLEGASRPYAMFSGCTTGCSQFTDTRGSSRCSQSSRKSHRACGGKGERSATAHDRGGTDQASIGVLLWRTTSTSRCSSRVWTPGTFGVMRTIRPAIAPPEIRSNGLR
jgi:hypothetical protein